MWHDGARLVAGVRSHEMGEGEEEISRRREGTVAVPVSGGDSEDVTATTNGLTLYTGWFQKGKSLRPCSWPGAE